jgi:hypothetical protein
MNNPDSFIFLCLIFIIIVSIIYSNYNYSENFRVGPGYYKSYCSSCGDKSLNACSSCVNCGICITPDNKLSCVNGDSSGPYFRRDCKNYIYGTPIINNNTPVIAPIKYVRRYPFYRWRRLPYYYFGW